MGMNKQKTVRYFGRQLRFVTRIPPLPSGGLGMSPTPSFVCLECQFFTAKPISRHNLVLYFMLEQPVPRQGHPVLQ